MHILCLTPKTSEFQLVVDPEFWTNVLFWDVTLSSPTPSPPYLPTLIVIGAGAAPKSFPWTGVPQSHGWWNPWRDTQGTRWRQLNLRANLRWFLWMCPNYQCASIHLFPIGFPWDCQGCMVCLPTYIWLIFRDQMSRVFTYRSSHGSILWDWIIGNDISGSGPLIFRTLQWLEVIFGIYMDVSKNSGFSPQIIRFNKVFHYKPSILRYPYFWKHPYEQSHPQVPKTQRPEKPRQLPPPLCTVFWDSAFPVLHVMSAWNHFHLHQPKTSKRSIVKNPQISPKTSNLSPDPKPPQKNSNHANSPRSESISRSSQPFPNRLSVLGGSSQLVSG